MKSKLIFLGILIFMIGCSNRKISKEAEYALIRGVNFSQQKEYSKAMFEYEKSYAIDPNNLVLLKELGYCYYQFGDFEKAEKFWLEGLKLSKKDENIIKNLATLYYEQRKFDKSLKVMEEAYNINDGYYLKLKALIVAETDKVEAYNIFKKMNIEDFDVYSSIKYMEILKFLSKKNELYYFMKNGYSFFREDRDYILNYAENLSEVYLLNRETEEILLRYLAEKGKDESIILKLSNLYLKNGDKKKSEDILELISY